MSSRTYAARVIVLRKTRLREADLVLTLLAQDGSQVRAVAKGALKPAGSFASRLELYSCADVLLVEGRSLDIVKEARIVAAHAPLRFDYDRSVCAAPMAEMLAAATQDGLAVPRLFDMTQTALAALEAVRVPAAPLVMVGFLLKATSILGFRPSLAHCSECGEPRPAGARWAYSPATGGVLCPDCAPSQAARFLPPGTVDWADTLIHATFASIAGMPADARVVRELVYFAQEWVQAHIGRLKSIPFVLSDPALMSGDAPAAAGGARSAGDAGGSGTRAG